MWPYHASWRVMAEADKSGSQEGRTMRPHKRVGNVSPGAVSGRTASLSSRRFRERNEDRVRWDPVDEVHYVSSSRSVDEVQPEDVPRAPSVDDDVVDEVPYERPTRRRPERAERVPWYERIWSVFEAIGLLPGRIASWVMSHRRLSLALGIVVVIVLFMYGPVAGYYQAWRASGELQAEYETAQADNEALRDDLDRLQSEEGIEDEARKRGYTFPNEESTSAEGVSDDTDQGSSASDSSSYTDDTEQPWYIHVLDVILGYDGSD